MSDKPKMEMVISEADAKALIQSCADSILAKMSERGEVLQWGTQQHNSLLYRLAVALGMPETAMKDFMVIMAISGVGGNASQFRQSKFVVDKLPKTTQRKAILDAY